MRQQRPHWDELSRLFKPGPGKRPPVLAGRDDELAEIREAAVMLPRGQPPESDVVLIGPRGNGKTALLRTFERDFEGQSVDVVEILPALIPNVESLARHLLDKGTPSHVKPVAKARLGLGTIASVEVGTTADVTVGADLVRSLADKVMKRCANRPMLVMVDEAHTLDPTVVKALLTVSQKVQSKGPFMVVLAGTPGLRDMLREADVTFWNRSTVLSVGRLRSDATEQAIFEPMRNHGVSCHVDAVQMVVEDSHGYPYFAQLWGRALCRSAARRHNDNVRPADVAEAFETVDEIRTGYYADRVDEMYQSWTHDAACAIAREFERRDRTNFAGLVKCVADASESGDMDEAKRQVNTLTDFGYVWRPHRKSPNEWEPGIPSLMSALLRWADEVQVPTSPEQGGHGR